MKKAFQQLPFFVWLLPVFFVLHGYLENFGYIAGWDCLVLTGEYILATAIGFGIFYLLYRNGIRTSLMVTGLFSIYFFFGAIHEFFYDHSIFLYKYRFLLPLLATLSVFLLIYLKRSRSVFPRLVLFLNSLLFIYLLVDGSKIIWKSLHRDSDKLSVYHLPHTRDYRTCDSCPNPDIYFLLFDEYGSSAALMEKYHYDNTGLDSFLRQQGFRVQTASRSNYNFTPFCMASILNMSYIQGIGNMNRVDMHDFVTCNTLIRNNESIKFLSSRGYEIVNYSIFDLAGSPSPYNQFLLPLKTNLITGRTLFFLLYRDLGWNLLRLPAPFNKLFPDLTFKSLEDNNSILEKTVGESRIRRPNPRLVYAHFEMPHSPFYYDRNSHLRDEKQLNKELFETGDPWPYLDYLPYTNGKIKELVGEIRRNTQDSAVIILMGDHGYREKLLESDDMHHFQNLNAVYFPDRDYRLLYDSISGVNQFRVVFDKLFGQNFHLLSDSTITLRDNR